MSPEQKIKREILIQARTDDPQLFDFNAEINEDNIFDLYDILVEEDAHWDYEGDFRCSGEDSNISSPSSRHYETREQARQLSCGCWVGWTYWYGGGKHGNPEDMEWMPHAYELDSPIEHVETIIVRKFTKKETRL